MRAPNLNEGPKNLNFIEPSTSTTSSISIGTLCESECIEVLIGYSFYDVYPKSASHL